MYVIHRGYRQDSPRFSLYYNKIGSAKYFLKDFLSKNKEYGEYSEDKTYYTTKEGCYIEFDEIECEDED
jgi:hypothetical protein